MTPLTKTLAMMRYNSFWESLFSPQTLSLLACVGSVTAFVCFIYFAYRRFPLRGPYFGQLFILGVSASCRSSCFGTQVSAKLPLRRARKSRESLRESAR